MRSALLIPYHVLTLSEGTWYVYDISGNVNLDHLVKDSPQVSPLWSYYFSLWIFYSKFSPHSKEGVGD